MEAFIEMVLTRRMERIQDGKGTVRPGLRRSSLQERLRDPGVAEIVQKAGETLRDIPEVRSDKVASIRKAMTEGSLPLDGETLAGRMLQECLLNELL